MIEREQAIIGALELDNHWRPPWANVTTLQEGVDSERTAARLIGALWVVVIVLLVFAAK